MIFLPGSKLAGNSGNNIQFNGDIGITVFAHEIRHSINSHAYGTSPFSNGDIWLNNYNQDSAVTDSYSQTSQQENFTQQTVVALFDKVVPGGVGTIQSNWQAIFH